MPCAFNQWLLKQAAEDTHSCPAQASSLEKAAVKPKRDVMRRRATSQLGKRTRIQHQEKGALPSHVKHHRQNQAGIFLA